MGGECSTIGEEEKFIQGLVGKPEMKKLIGRPSRISYDNIKMDHKEIGWQGVNWISLAEDKDKWRAVVKMILRVS